MNLMKWFRKNNKKLMAAVVIVIMFAFVGGSALKFFLQRSASSINQAMARYGNNKITRLDIQTARQELELLKMLKCDAMLRSIIEPISRRSDLRSIFMGELLFGESASSARLMGDLRRTIRQNEYHISLKQINDIYRHTATSDIYWLLLSKEAEEAGLKVANEDSGRYLAAMLPQLDKQMTYATVITSIVNRQGIPETQILSTFGKLLAVMEYARIACSDEDITVEQIRHAASFEQQAGDVEFVRFDSSFFAEEQGDPSQQEISAQFEKYKSFDAGDVTDDNPYGFGYKLPDRVRLEYIAVRIRDMADIVVKPTAEDAELFYMDNKNASEFQESVPADACDPNSQPIERTKTYAEVAEQILTMLLERKKVSKAEAILDDGREMTESSLGSIDREDKTLDTERFKKLAGDYKTTAEKLSSKYGIKIYSGETGLLSADEIRKDAYLPFLFVTGPRKSRVGLAQVVFAVDELEVSELGPFDVPKPRMFENIGLVRDMDGRIVMLARVSETQKAAAPESVDQTFSISTVDFSPAEPNADRSENIYSVRQGVVEDLKRLAVMDSTRIKATEFKNSIAKLGWDDAIAKLNNLYGPSDVNAADANIPDLLMAQAKPFRLDGFKNLHRISSSSVAAFVRQSERNPTGMTSLGMIRQHKRLIDRFYSLIPPDSNSLDTVPMIIEFKPQMSFYCLKSLTINRIGKKQYEQTKSIQAYKEELIRSQSLSVVHFNPKNIEKRMGFEWVAEQKRQKQAADANAPVESNTPGES